MKMIIREVKNAEGNLLYYIPSRIAPKINLEAETFKFYPKDIVCPIDLTTQTIEAFKESEFRRDLDVVRAFELPISSTTCGLLSSKKVGAWFAKEIRKRIETNETDIAYTLNSLFVNNPQKLNDYPNLRKVAEKVHKTFLLESNKGKVKRNELYRLPRFGKRISDSTIAYLLGMEEKLKNYNNWKNAKRGVSFKQVNELQNFFSYMYRNSNFISDFLKLFNNYRLPSSLNLTTEPAIYCDDLKKLFLTYELEIIDFLERNPNRILKVNPRDFLTSKQFLDKYIEDHPFLHQKRFIRSVDGLVSNYLFSYLIGVDHNTIDGWSTVDYITPYTYQDIEDHISNLFGDYILDTSLFSFKLALDSFNKAPSLLIEKTVKKQLIHYFKTGERYYAHLKKHSKVLTGLSKISRDAKPIIKETIIRLFADKDFLWNELFLATFPKEYFAYLTASLVKSKLEKSSQFLNLISFIDFYFTMKYRKNQFAGVILNSFYDMIFGRTKTSWQKIINAAKVQNFEINLSLREWIIMVVNAKISGITPSELYLDYNCKKCGLTHKIQIQELIGGTGCPVCSKGKNEKITGAMIEELLLLLQKFKDIKIINVEVQVSVKKHFPLASSVRFSVSDMRFDFVVELQISGRKIVWVIESDGMQHSNDGKGFMAKVGIVCARKCVSLLSVSNAFIANIRKNLATIESINGILDYITGLEIMGFDVLTIKRYYNKWLKDLERDSLKNNLFKEQAFKYLTRVKTWELNYEERCKKLIDDFIKLLGSNGMDPSVFSNYFRSILQKDLLNSQINWEIKISKKSKFNLWSPLL